MANFLMEIIVEEFPPTFLKPVADYIKTTFETEMKNARIAPKNISIFYTCSRFALLADGMPEKQPDLEQKVFGAPKKIAVDKNGNLTKAGEAFVKKNNLKEWFFEQGRKDEIIAGIFKEKGRELSEILVEIFEKTMTTIPFKRSMRWADKELLFARPIRRIMMLINNKPVSHSFFGINFSEKSFGHRFLSPLEIEVSFESYKEKLSENFVMISFEERKEKIKNDIFRIAKKEGAKEKVDEDLLNEISNIVEYPFAITGKINEKYMRLPHELITKVLKQDQRYVTLYKNDTILPTFISILNNKPTNPEIVSKGNEKVVSARLADAEFYYDSDLSEDFKTLTLKLKEVLFQRKLGSYFDKVNRISNIAKFVAQEFFRLDDKIAEKIAKDALLIKNDLITGVVKEFPDLQGTMGKYYAQNAKLENETALAMEEHYKPVFLGDKLPQTTTGKILAIADKTDTIVGGFMAGMKPTGSKDKFAIRRNSITLLKILIEEKNPEIDIEKLINFAENEVLNTNQSLKKQTSEIKDFFKQRYYAVFNSKKQVIQSSIETDFNKPFDVLKRIETIEELLKDDSVYEMAQLLKRSKNILKKAKNIENEIDISLFETEEEKLLFETLNLTKEKIKNIENNLEVAKEIIKIKPALDRFFDKVLVMAKDEKIKQNRISLIEDVVRLGQRHIGDISFLNI